MRFADSGPEATVNRPECVTTANPRVRCQVRIPADGVDPALRQLVRIAAASDIAMPAGQLRRSGGPV
jgi:hypothetical protein